MVFDHCDIILMRIIDQPTITDIKQECYDEKNNTNSMVKTPWYFDSLQKC